MSALFEALTGASFDEIVSDYMTTYENYYHVEKGSEQYRKIARSNIITSMLTVVANEAKDADPSKIDWQAAAKGYKYGDILKVRFDNGFEISGPFLDGYFVDTGKFLVRAYPGHDNVGLCINYGKLNEVAGIGIGSRFNVEMVEEAGYLDEYLARNLSRTNDIKDYGYNEKVFANFRMLSYGETGDRILYRSSSPVNNELGRAEYADKLMKEAGVKTVINLADRKEQVEGFLADKSFSTPYYESLFRKGQVLTLNLGLSYKSDEFRQGIVKACEFMADKEGPYLFHCTEGKDRTGFMGALLNALMGASKDQIVEDYMRSFENFYNVTKKMKDVIRLFRMMCWKC